jgi:hypothetical protein
MSCFVQIQSADELMDGASFPPLGNDMSKNESLSRHGDKYVDGDS